jgi:uncharacterized membrane protein YidH (DUF202 family)
MQAKNKNAEGPNTPALKRDLLAQMRTLLAVERNYLAEERTQLAQFRTGIALALFAPPSGAIYFPSSVTLQIPLWISVIIMVFFAGITIVGLNRMWKAHQKLQRIRKQKAIVKEKEFALMAQDGDLNDLMEDCISAICDF